MTRQQHLGWFLARGFGPHGWGHDYLDWNYDWTRPDLYVESARALEQAGVDLLIIEDAPSLGSPETIDLRVRQAFGGPKHDPLLLAPYLFAATRHLGVVPTVNPAAVLPYTGARQLATLQHLSGGRFGLNLVTDTGSARHFSATPPLGHDAAYDRAEEWLAGVRSLWRSWDDGALIADPGPVGPGGVRSDAVLPGAARSGIAGLDRVRPGGRYADGRLLRPVRHRGEHYAFDGPLNALPFADGADGEPVIVSPGGSGRGLAFAGANSDVQLALAPLTERSVRDYRARIHAAARTAGRALEHVKVLFAIKPVLVSSPQEADRLVAASADPDDGTLLRIAEQQSSDLETDLTALDLDEPLPTGLFGDHVSHGSIKRLVGDHDLATTPLRVLLGGLARLGRIADRTGWVGTAGELADLIEELGEWGNDGVLLWGDLHPVTVHRTLDDLVPILRRRGILRTEWADGGLRANLRAF